MTIVSEQDSWPKEPYRDPATGLVCMVDRRVCDLVHMAVSEWTRRTGYEPTHVLLGPREMRILRSQERFHMIYTGDKESLSKLLGMELVKTIGNGLRIFGDFE